MIGISTRNYRPNNNCNMRILSRFLPIIILLAMTYSFFGCTTDGPLEPSKDQTEQPIEKPDDKPTDEPSDEPSEEPGDDVQENPEDKPTEEYVRLTFSSSENNENLIFEWDNIEVNSERNNYISFFVSDGEKPIRGKSSNESGTPDKEVAYSGMAVTPHEGNGRCADFQTVDYYDVSKFATPTYCFAVAGNTPITENITSGQNLFRIEMPSSFIQTSTDDPDFLKEHMTMYASATYNQNGTNLDFKQVPAVLKFIVKNATSSVVSLQEVSVGASNHVMPMTRAANLPSLEDNIIADEMLSVASSSADISFDWANGDVHLSFADRGHNKVTISAGDGISLSDGETFTAYSAVLPLSEEDAFADKLINISIKFNEIESVVTQIDYVKFAELNSAEIYNWVSGKTYAIEINLDNDCSATGRIISENDIEVTSSFPGRYTLKYIGEDGMPLTDYSAICTLKIDQLACYEDFIDVNVFPRDADAIGIYDSSNEHRGTISITDIKPDYSERPAYSFGLLSDVHVGRPASSMAEADFERALQFFNSKATAMTCICGDITENALQTEYQSYASITSKSSVPVYTTTGNHDCIGADGVNAALWKQYTGQQVVFEKSVEINGKIDHYLFLGMSYYNFVAPYFEHHLNWLEDKLEEYRNERCFVFTHLFFPDRAGNLNDIYPSKNWLRGTQLERLQGMCNRYVNTLWFSGHSHWMWSLQKYQDRANIHRLYEGGQPVSGWSVHVPSCADPINSNGTSRENIPAESEGAIVEVYENHIDILGLNLLSGKYLPVATYRLDTSMQPVAPRTNVRQEHYLKASDFVVNASKPGATVRDVEDKPNYVEVTFTGKKQGFYVANSTYTSNSSKVSVVVEDVKAYSDGELIDVPANVGFYGENYYLTATNMAEVSTGDNAGVQFQTSSSKYEGPLPLTIQMKTQMVFYVE